LIEISLTFVARTSRTGINDGRIDSPLLSRDQWNDALLGAGFSGVEIAAKDYEGAAHRSAVLISKAVAKEDGPRETIPANVLMSPTWAAKDRPEFVINLNTALWEAALPTSTRPLISQTEFSPDALHIVLDDGANPILKADSPELFDVVKKLLVHSTRILWVTVQEDLSAVRNPEKGMIHGFARVARGENPQLRLVTLDIQDAAVGSKCASIIQKIKDVALTSFYGPEAMRSSEFEYAYQDGQLCVPRLVPDAKLNRLVRQTGGDVQIQSQPFHQPARPLKLQVPQSGLLEDLHFVDDDAPQGLLSDDEIEVQVEACGINSVDVAIASGQVKKPLPMAGEYSGTVAGVPSALRNQFKVGDRVCGFGATAYASRIKANAVTVCRIPESMSFATAAAVSIAFSTAYLGLVDIARLHKGQTVLIHAASGGVDQAALTIAKHIGSEIFATASSESGRRLLIDQFGIPEDHVFSSNTGVFKKGVLRLTGGKGVDVILNSLSGQLLQDSWASIASFGTFVELGKTDVQSKTAVLGMAPFDRHVTFASVDMSLMCLQQPEKAGRILKLVMSMFGDGLYAPMNPITVMPITEIEEAFRLLKTGKTVGKVVLEANSTANVKAVSKPSPEEGMRLKANATYMIAGGVGGLGVEIALYMVTRGARHIVLLSRRGLQGIKLQELQDRFRKLGAEVVVFATDITDPSKVQQMFQTCAQTLPPIAGIIQASMVLKVRFHVVPLSSPILRQRELTPTNFSGSCNGANDLGRMEGCHEPQGRWHAELGQSNGRPAA
jgi:NADPH:quinone reductase-like Zn-dependent oxidoreductase